MGDEADAMWKWEIMDKAAEDFGGNRPSGVVADWHGQRTTNEPRCGADQWRARDREEILYMHEMTDSHLRHCIRFAKTKPQHASRLPSLLKEQNRRKHTK